MFILRQTRALPNHCGTCGTLEKVGQTCCFYIRSLGYTFSYTQERVRTGFKLFLQVFLIFNPPKLKVSWFLQESSVFLSIDL